jgi:hypothetical protein
MGFFETDFLTFLNPVELRLLKLTCHLFNNAIKKSVIENCITNTINHNLHTNFIDDLPLIDLLKETNAFISGSFILQCILNEFYDSDIDIYIPYNEQSMVLIDAFFENYCKCSDTGEYDGDEAGSNKMKRVLDYIVNHNYEVVILNDELSMNEQLVEHKYKKMDNCKYNYIQFIYLNVPKDNMIDYINKNFDFDLCKNMYDVKNNTIYTHSLNSILNKTFDFKIGEWVFFKTADRAIKYKKRGFKMNIPYTIEHLININYPNNKVTIYQTKLIEENEDYVYCELFDDVEKLNPIAYYLQPYINHIQNIKILRKLRDKHVNHISLSKLIRNTCIDQLIDFYYEKNYQILWTYNIEKNATEYYVFLY